jgi:hypothetical protein
MIVSGDEKRLGLQILLGKVEIPRKTHHDFLRIGTQVKYPHSCCSSFTALFNALAVDFVYWMPPVTPPEKSAYFPLKGKFIE